MTMRNISIPNIVNLSFTEALDTVRACSLCQEALPFTSNPVIKGSETATLLIIGQAPGLKVHQSSIPWDDASGNRLRQWLKLDSEVFYDEARIAIMPMGFCYPGKGKSGDLPPRPECASTWHEALKSKLPNIGLTLLIGQYAQSYYLKDKRSLTERVRHFRDYLSDSYIPLPHPSPRNNIWLRKHPWFETENLPTLQAKLASLGF